jgi:hypothetical protein
MMMAQVGVRSTAGLVIHNHLNDINGGVLNDYSRDGAFKRPYRTGALACSCDNDAIKSTVGDLILLKQTRINKAQIGTYRIEWKFYNSDNMTWVESRLALNGVFISTNRTQNTNLPVLETHNFDVGFSAGDLLQVYGTANGDEVFVEDLRIRFDWRIENFGQPPRNTLIAALGVTDVDLLDFTILDP